MWSIVSGTHIYVLRACLQVLLDAAADEKVSWGSYHAVTDMIPSLAVRYPYMCYGFLAGLALQKVGDLEVPVNVITEIDRSVGGICVGAGEEGMRGRQTEGEAD